MAQVKKEDALKFLANIEGDKAFYVCNGVVLRNLQETSNCLNILDNKIFEFHVNKEKNDFYNWIKNVICDAVLANKIKGIKTGKTMAKKIDDRINQLKKALNK